MKNLVQRETCSKSARPKSSENARQDPIVGEEFCHPVFKLRGSRYGKVSSTVHDDPEKSGACHSVFDATAKKIHALVWEASLSLPESNRHVICDIPSLTDHL